MNIPLLHEHGRRSGITSIDDLSRFGSVSKQWPNRCICICNRDTEIVEEIPQISSNRIWTDTRLGSLASHSVESGQADVPQLPLLRCRETSPSSITEPSPSCDHFSNFVGRRRSLNPGSANSINTATWMFGMQVRTRNIRGLLHSRVDHSV